MSEQPMRIAELSPEQLARLQTLEQKLGSYVVALQPKLTPAELNPDQLAQLQQAEDDLGVVLLAYRK